MIWLISLLPRPCHECNMLLIANMARHHHALSDLRLSLGNGNPLRARRGSPNRNIIHAAPAGKVVAKRTSHGTIQRPHLGFSLGAIKAEIKALNGFHQPRKSLLPIIAILTKGVLDQCITGFHVAGLLLGCRGHFAPFVSGSRAAAIAA